MPTTPLRWTNNLGVPGFGTDDYDAIRAQGYSDDQIKQFLQSNRSFFGKGGINVNDALRAKFGLGDEYSNADGRSDSERQATAAQRYQDYTKSLSSASNNFSTIPGQLTNSGLSGLTELGNKYKDNETIGGLVVGTLADTYRTQVNTGNALAYNDAFIASLGKYQQGLETLKSGNAMNLMAAEGRIAKDLQGDQLNASRYIADQELRGVETQSAAQRYIGELQSSAQRYGAELGLKGVETQAGAQRYTAEQQAGAQRYGAELGLKGVESQSEAQRYTAEQQAGAQRYGAELGLRGVESQSAAQRYSAEQQAGAQRYTAEQAAGAQRYGAELGLKGVETQSAAQRYTSELETAAQRYGAEQAAGAQRYSAEQAAGAQRYGAELGLKGVESQSSAQRYVADTQLSGTKYVSDSEERRIGLKGDEDRKTLESQTNQQLALRRDARGAIARVGSRFYS